MAAHGALHCRAGNEAGILEGMKSMKLIITMVFSFILTLAAATQAGHDGLVTVAERVQYQTI